MKNKCPLCYSDLHYNEKRGPIFKCSKCSYEILSLPECMKGNYGIDNRSENKNQQDK